MRIRSKIFIGYLILVIAGFYFFSKWVLDDVRKNYLESVEETMVDAAYILAAFVEHEIQQEKFDIKALKDVFQSVNKQRFSAKIYDMTKGKVTLNVYITDRHGIVLFDSAKPQNEGTDFSRWLDVKRTLNGEYGARATRKIKDDPRSLVLYVSAPIRLKNQIDGVVTVYKSVNVISLFIDNTKHRIIHIGIVVGLLVFVLGLILSAWLTSPIHRLTEYAKNIRDREKVSYPKLGKGEIGELGEAFEEMREALEGKKYVENYVQHLTHELKSPISAIKGAMEFLDDPQLDQTKHQKLLNNINFETGRMQQIVDRMLQLSNLESQKTLTHKESLNLKVLLNELICNARDAYPTHFFQFQSSVEQPMIIGERFLLYQAFDNILRNAIDFSPEKSTISIDILRNSQQQLEVVFIDRGTGIPDYALEKVFDKFYSLPRPEKGKKSSGLGLSIVKEIASLHYSTISIKNQPSGGVQVSFTFTESMNKPKM